MGDKMKISISFNDDNKKETDGLDLKLENNTLVVTGNSEDLTEFADIIYNLVKEESSTHIHLDKSTLLSNDSSISEIIIDKK